jgi:hypothetical protein
MDGSGQPYTYATKTHTHTHTWMRCARVSGRWLAQEARHSRKPEYVMSLNKLLTPSGL